MRIGLIGLGDIAQKAYLPVLSANEDIELLLCTRDAHVLHALSRKYRIQQSFTQLGQLLNATVDAVMIHAATEAHEVLIEKCLNHHVHVFVDKPIAYDYATSKRLMALAKAKNLILMVGFNRRYSQPYLPYLTGPAADFIMVEKHRSQQAGPVRQFVFDDFIHVIDTILNFFRQPIEGMQIEGKMVKGQLYRVMLTVKGENQTALGLMNRDAGMQEEVAKLFYPTETVLIEDIRDQTILQGDQIRRKSPNDWTATLETRGFYQMTDDFFKKIKHFDSLGYDYDRDLIRHEIAEEIVSYFEK